MPELFLSLKRARQAQLAFDDRSGRWTYTDVKRRIVTMRFRAGKIVEAQAAQGSQVLQRMIETDEGARRLGEVALVPHSSPIAASGLMLKKALFDENAACHIALGQSFSSCVKNGDNLTLEQLASHGANNSLIHVDCMIGSNRIDIDGISSGGDSEPVMRAGEWV